MESATKIQKYLYAAANCGIRVLLILVLFGLSLQSMFSTSFIGLITNEDGSVQERTLNIADSPCRHLLVFAVSIAVLAALIRGWRYARKQRVFCDVYGKISALGILKILCIFTGISGCFWILATQLRPASDPAKIYAIAMQWRELNFSAFAEGGYLFRYPYQSGIVLFYYLLSFLFGIDNFIALQLINVAALILVYYFLAKLAGAYWKEDRKIQAAVYIGLAAWLPLFFYVTYLYGILPGMALSLAAVYTALRYLETRKSRHIAASALCIGLATVFKMNCLIYLVAISCFLVYDIIVTFGWKNRIRSFLFILLMILSVKGLNQAVYSYVEHLSGYEMPEGEVMLSWVVMGLQDTPLGPGGYSGYIGDVFLEYHYDTEKITEASLTEIKNIMTDMSENWYDKGLPFFARKNAFQWNDPTFISLHLSRNRWSSITLSDSVQSVLEGTGSVRLSVLLNDAQTLILLGALCCLMGHFKSRNLYELFGGVIFLGGYLFHFFWESSSSYTIPYFVMLIPYAVKGLLDAARRVETVCSAMVCRIQGTKAHLWQTLRPETASVRLCRWAKRNVFKIAFVIIYLSLLFILQGTNLFTNTIALSDGESAREQFYAGRQTAERQFSDGYYFISPVLEEEMALAERDGDIVAVSPDEGKTQKIAVVMSGESTVLRFRDSERILAVLPEEDNRLVSYMDDSMNMFYENPPKAYTEWILHTAEPGESCYIMINGLALTYDMDTKQIFLENWEEKETQRWNFK